MKGLTRLTNHLSMMSPASSLSAVCASLSSKISLTLSFTEKRSFLIAPPSVPNQFRICEGALPVFPVPGMRQRNDALHALFFKFPIAVDIDFFQKNFPPFIIPDKFIIKHFRARVNTFFAPAPHQRAGDLQGAFSQKNIPPEKAGQILHISKKFTAYACAAHRRSARRYMRAGRRARSRSPSCPHRSCDIRRGRRRPARKT